MSGTFNICLVHSQHEYHSQHMLSRKLSRKLTLIIFPKPTEGRLSGIAITIRHSNTEGCTQTKAKAGN